MKLRNRSIPYQKITLFNDINNDYADNDYADDDYTLNEILDFTTDDDNSEDDNYNSDNYNSDNSEDDSDYRDSLYHSDNSYHSDDSSYHNQTKYMENFNQRDKNQSCKNQRDKHQSSKNEISSSISKYFNFTRDDREYFKNLDTVQKNKIIDIKNTFDKHLIDVKPTIFKILESNIPIESKIEVIKKFKENKMLDKSSTEYYKSNDYINGILRIPFKKYNDLKIDNPSDYIQQSKKVLDNIVFGHDRVKIHILEILGQYLSAPKSIGNVFGIYGPMGIGKTTLIKDGLSSVLKRPFNFITLGGASDSSFLDGHSYTYEGSRYGKIIECLVKSKCMNPIFYFDELDKISDTPKGDEITNLLIHLTDDSQNDKYQDKFFSGIDIDLSRAIFVFSFNDLEKVNPILRDRLNIIKLDGFKKHEKVTIAKDFLIKTITDEFDISDLKFTDDCIEYLIDTYSREKGVRELKRKLKEIISKLNLSILSQNKIVQIDDQINFNSKIIITREIAISLLK